MGLLDDAIRDHMELKRKHGADSDELTRIEQEALADPRNAQPTGEHEVPAEGEAPAAPSGELQAGDPLLEDPTLNRAEETGTGLAFEDEPVVPTPAEPVAPEPELAEPLHANHGDRLLDPEATQAHEQVFEDEVVEEVESAVADPGPVTYVDGDTDEEDILPVGDAQSDVPEPGPDLLEGTPDFLEETPEHDRAWFEKKAPRDFDFEG